MIFDNPIFLEAILPFLLVFVLVFAILQKTKILGEDKHQIDALVSLAIALILISVPAARNIVVNLMPWLAVGLSVIFIFLILYGFVVGDLTRENVPSWLKNGAAVFAVLFTVGTVFYVTSLWDWLGDWLSQESCGDVWISIVMILVIVGVVVVAVKGDKWGKGTTGG